MRFQPDNMSLLCELVYVPKDAAPLVFSLPWSPQMMVMDVIQQSGWLQDYPEIESLEVGIFASRVSRDTVVKAGDRLEIYRPLEADPKEKRRRLAKNRSNSAKL